jgi:kynureninase
MPKSAAERAKQVIDEEWGVDLIRGWNKGWWDAPTRIGDKIGKLIGAEAGQVIVTDTVSSNLFKLATAALTHQPNKKRIITDIFNFPSDLYILQGIQHLLTNGSTQYATRSNPHRRNDNDITPDLAALESAINENTALVTLSHVSSKAATSTTCNTSPNSPTTKARSSSGT